MGGMTTVYLNTDLTDEEIRNMAKSQTKAQRSRAMTDWIAMTAWERLIASQTASELTPSLPLVWGTARRGE